VCVFAGTDLFVVLTAWQLIICLHLLNSFITGMLYFLCYRSWGRIFWILLSWFLSCCIECRHRLVMRILSVSLSVRLSVIRLAACDTATTLQLVTTVQRFVQSYISDKRSFRLVFWEEEWLVGGGDPLYLKLWVNWPLLEQIRLFCTDNRS